MKLHLALLLSTSLATAVSNAADTQPHTLLQATGVLAQFAVLEEWVVSSSQDHAKRCGSTPPLTTVPGFNAESITFDAVNSLNRQSKLNKSAWEAVAIWFESPLAIKIHKAEQTSIGSDAQQYFADLRDDQITLQRLENIVVNTRTIDFISIVGAETEYAGLLHSGCIAKAAHTADEQKNPEEVMAEIIRSDTTTAKMIEPDIILELGYLLRNLTEAELTAYESFTNSTAAKAFYTGVINSVTTSLQLASNRINLQHSSSKLNF